MDIKLDNQLSILNKLQSFYPERQSLFLLLDQQNSLWIQVQEQGKFLWLNYNSLSRYYLSPKYELQALYL